MNFLGIGLLELLVIGGLAYFLLGPRRMSEVGRTVGKALREMRRQRDELTAMLMSDPEEDRPAPGRSARAADSASAHRGGEDSTPDSGGHGAPPRSGVN